MIFQAIYSIILLYQPNARGEGMPMEEEKQKSASKTPIEHLQREKKLRKRAQKELQTTQKKVDQHKEIISEQK